MLKNSNGAYSAPEITFFSLEEMELLCQSNVSDMEYVEGSWTDLD